MSNVVSLIDEQPHYTIPTPNGDVHVLPEILLRDIANGRVSIDAIEDRDQVLRGIISDWMDSFER